MVSAKFSAVIRKRKEYPMRIYQENSNGVK